VGEQQPLEPRETSAIRPGGGGLDAEIAARFTAARAPWRQGGFPAGGARSAPYVLSAVWRAGLWPLEPFYPRQPANVCFPRSWL